MYTSGKNASVADEFINNFNIQDISTTKLFNISQTIQDTTCTGCRMGTGKWKKTEALHQPVFYFNEMCKASLISHSVCGLGCCR